MIVYKYEVKKQNLSDDELKCLQGKNFVFSSHSPKELKTYSCSDFKFPNGDTFPLHTDNIDLLSCEAEEI